MKYKQIIKRTEKSRRGRKLLSKRIVLITQKLYVKGLTMRQVSARVGIALGSVHKILSGNHPNQVENMDELKRKESIKLYLYLCKRYKFLRNRLPALREISWMRMKEKVILIDRVIARRVSGALQPAEGYRTESRAENTVAVA